MNDTSERVKEILSSMMNSKERIDRLKMGFSMFEFSKKIVYSSIEDKKNWRVELFERFYGNNYNEYEKIKIKERLVF